MDTPKKLKDFPILIPSENLSIINAIKTSIDKNQKSKK